MALFDKNPRSARRARMGAVMVEYALIVAFVAVPTVIGVGLGGVELTKSYTAQRTRILLPFP
jgi:Flp pilus assembly pilin Flp